MRTIRLVIVLGVLLAACQQEDTLAETCRAARDVNSSVEVVVRNPSDDNRRVVSDDLRRLDQTANHHDEVARHAAEARSAWATWEYEWLRRGDYDDAWAAFLQPLDEVLSRCGIEGP